MTKWDKRPQIPAGTPFSPAEQRRYGVYTRKHGTRSGYAAGCRCGTCTYANTTYKTALRRRKAERVWRATSAETRRRGLRSL